MKQGGQQRAKYSGHIEGNEPKVIAIREQTNENEKATTNNNN